VGSERCYVRFWRFLKDNPAFVSALCAALSLCFMIMVWVHSCRLTAPWEKPILTCTRISVHTHTVGPDERLYFNLTMFIKNIGRRPAKSVRIQMWLGDSNDPARTQPAMDYTIANTIYAETKYDPYLRGKFPPGVDDVTAFEKIWLIYLRMTYEDAFSCKKERPTEGYYLLNQWNKTVDHATTQDRDKFEPYLRKLGAFNN